MDQRVTNRLVMGGALRICPPDRDPGEGLVVSPNPTFPLHESPQNVVTERILGRPRVTLDVQNDLG